MGDLRFREKDPQIFGQRAAKQPIFDFENAEQTEQGLYYSIYSKSQTQQWYAGFHLKQSDATEVGGVFQYLQTTVPEKFVPTVPALKKGRTTKEGGEVWFTIERALNEQISADNIYDWFVDRIEELWSALKIKGMRK